MISETGERQYKNWDRKKVALKTVRSSKVFSSSHFSFIHILEHFVLVVRLEQLVWHTHREIHEITFELYRCIHGENLVEIQITFLRQFSLVRWYWLVWRRYIHDDVVTGWAREENRERRQMEKWKKNNTESFQSSSSLTKFDVQVNGKYWQRSQDTFQVRETYKMSNLPSITCPSNFHCNRILLK